jgi:predicted nuclease of restriction endonuclease-like (RecB) superfamily
MNFDELVKTLVDIHQLTQQQAVNDIQQLARPNLPLKSTHLALRDPSILSFLGLDPPIAQAPCIHILNHLKQYFLELGKGFLFESRQKRFSFEEDHFYVDLVFYNRLLRCYVLIDLKIDKLTHQDLGQMQMYVNYFDRFVKTPDENPTIGIVLCKRKKDALVELTLPPNANIFAAQYQLYLPSKEELQRQIQAAAQETGF